MSFDDFLIAFSPKNSTWRSGYRKALVLMGATGFYSGYLPLAPGTFGSLVGVALIYLIFPSSVFLQVALCIKLTLLGVWLSAAATHIYKKADPQRVVVDEIVGVMITMVGMPITPYWLVMGFLVFRVLDVMKPVPANYFDSRVKGGWGVMLDDVVAGIYGCVLLHLMLRARL